MEIEQMMAPLLEEMRTNQAKMDANFKEIKKDIRTNYKKMNASQERMIAEVDVWLSETRAWRKEMKSD
jgi:hypothetical protein